MKANGGVLLGFVGLVLGALWVRGGSRVPPAPTVTPAAVAEPPRPLAQAPGTTRFALSGTGLATFLIDAPLEKIRGRATVTRGTIDVDPSDLRKTRGEVDVDLDSLKTETFDDSDRNAAQTLHAHNWMEIGAETSPAVRDANRWARFTVGALAITGASKLGDVAAAADGTRLVHAVVHGTVTIHGVPEPASVDATITFGADPHGGTVLRVQSTNPFDVSLKTHDVKPRDVAGRFLEGALEKTGRKIDDDVQISVDVSASGPKILD